MGLYLASAEAGGYYAGELVLTPLSFPIPLAEPIVEESNVKFVPLVGGSPPPAPPECENPDSPGDATVNNPEADPGYLCIYEETNEGNALSYASPSGPGGHAVGRLGTFIAFEVGSPTGFSKGTWAVTAPLAGP